MPHNVHETVPHSGLDVRPATADAASRFLDFLVHCSMRLSLPNLSGLVHKVQALTSTRKENIRKHAKEIRKGLSL